MFHSGSTSLEVTGDEAEGTGTLVELSGATASDAQGQHGLKSVEDVDDAGLRVTPKVWPFHFTHSTTSKPRTNLIKGGGGREGSQRDEKGCERDRERHREIEREG